MPEQPTQNPTEPHPALGAFSPNQFVTATAGPFRALHGHITGTYYDLRTREPLGWQVSFLQRGAARLRADQLLPLATRFRAFQPVVITGGFMHGAGHIITIHPDAPYLFVVQIGPVSFTATPNYIEDPYATEATPAA